MGHKEEQNKPVVWRLKSYRAMKPHLYFYGGNAQYIYSIFISVHNYSLFNTKFRISQITGISQLIKHNWYFYHFLVFRQVWKIPYKVKSILVLHFYWKKQFKVSFLRVYEYQTKNAEATRSFLIIKRMN